VGDQVFAFLFYYQGKPDIDWIIWRATLYGAWNGWRGEGFGSDAFSWHMDQVHCTYVGAQATAVRTAPSPAPRPHPSDHPRRNP